MKAFAAILADRFIATSGDAGHGGLSRAATGCAARHTSNDCRSSSGG